MTNASSPARIAAWLRRVPESFGKDAGDVLRIVFRDNAGREDTLVHEWTAARVQAAIAGDENGRAAFADEVHQALQDDCDGRDRRSTYAVQAVIAGSVKSTHRLELHPGDRKPEDDLLAKPPGEEATPTGMLALTMRHMEVRERAMLGSIGTMQRLMVELLDRVAAQNDRYEAERGEMWELLKSLMMHTEDRELKKFELEQTSARWERVWRNLEEVVLPAWISQREDELEAKKAAAAASAPAKNGNGNKPAGGWMGGNGWAQIAAAALKSSNE